MRAERQQQGFTLTELMIVIAIIGVLSGLVFGLSSRTYGANAQNVSEQVVATCNLAKMRAVSTRRQQLVTIEPHTVTIWQAPNPGFAPVTSGTWVYVTRISLPNTVTAWNVSTTVYATGGASGISPNPSLAHDMIFRPDGSSAGGTIFITDYQNARRYRVLVYKITGASYAREGW